MATEYSIKALLLRHDIEVNGRDIWGSTPFMITCLRKYNLCSRALLDDPRVDPNIPMKDGVTPARYLICGVKESGLDECFASGRKFDFGTVEDWVLDDHPRHYSKGWFEQWQSSSLREYMREPHATMIRVRKELGLPSRAASDLFATAVFFSEGLLIVPNWRRCQESLTRFLHIVDRLPLELQMMLCQRASNSVNDYISANERELAFRRLKTELETKWHVYPSYNRECYECRELGACDTSLRYGRCD